MKTKNPLYVVKGKTVLEAKGVLDLLVKQLGLEPLMEMIMKVVRLLLSQVTNYNSLMIVKKIVDDLMIKVTHLVQIFQKA